MSAVRRPGPPVPPRPHAILLKTRVGDVTRTSSPVTAPFIRTGIAVAGSPSPRGAPASEGGRNIVYKSPSFNLERRQEERDKRYSFNTSNKESPLSKSTLMAKKPKPIVPAPTYNVTSSATDNRSKIATVSNNNNDITVQGKPPQPKPRTMISKAPTGFLRRSKTTLDNFTRSTITISHISNSDANNNNNPNNINRAGIANGHHRHGNNFMSGKSYDIKNNLKNAAERLFSEIVSHSKENKTQTKSFNHLPPLYRMDSAKSQESLSSDVDGNSNCARLNIKTTRPMLEDPIPPEKKIVFQEMLISELTAMRQRSSSVDQLSSRLDYNANENDPLELRQQKEEQPQIHDDKHILKDVSPIGKSSEEQSMEDSGTGSALALSFTEGTRSKRVRQRCPSGCSTDSSPCGTERSRIRTADWIEVGSNGKEEILTSCQISLEDSGLEDEERPDDGSFGVGESWDNLKQAKKDDDRQAQLRARRKVSAIDLPPLPKSLSMNQTFTESCEEILAKDNDIGRTTDAVDNTLGKQLAVLQKEMYGLRQLDISLLSQLWTLNDSIQNFRTLLDDQECYSPSPTRSRSPSPYDSVSSDVDDDLSPSIQTQIQNRTEADILRTSQSSTSPVGSPKTVLDYDPTQSPITKQPTFRSTQPPTPTPRSPAKSSPTQPRNTSPRQMIPKTLPPPPAPPATKPPVERLMTRPTSTVMLSGCRAPMPVQRMRIAPPPPPVQRRPGLPSQSS